MPLLGSDTAVTGPFPKGVLLLEKLVGTEELGMPYLFELGLLSRNPNIDAAAVLGGPLAVGIRLDSGDWRYFHGIVASFAKTGNARLHTRYRARLVPYFSQLDRTLDCRVWNDPVQDVVSIVTEVLGGRGLSDLEASGVKNHAHRARDYCVQYRESDLHFVQRLLEEEGIYYFFRHEETKHTMVLADVLTVHEPAAGYESVLYTPEERHAARVEEHFWGMRVRKGLFPGRHTVRAGYDPSKPRPQELDLGKVRSDERMPGWQFEHYDGSGGHLSPDEASDEAMLRSQADRVENTTIEVAGNTLGLGIGARVRLRPRGGDEIFPFWDADSFARQHLVVAATYHLSIDQYETGTAGSDQPFRATYRLLDSEVALRPRRSVRKPRMGGPQTALVVGPASEEIWTDDLGRVRVQFDWDRLGGRNEKSTCWVRVAEMWAGGRWGSMHLPRVGQEVIVRFLDGDPDRPIVAGALYNADNLPPYELAANATQSGIKSRSSKGGDASNFNEIRFEDKRGAEELRVQAERDLSTLVKHCQTLEVGKNRGVVVGKDEDNLVKADRDLTVGGKDSVAIGGDHDKTVNGTVSQIYGGNHSRKVDGDQELVAEKNKDERVQQAHVLTTDKRFQLVQDATSLTFQSKNVSLDSAGEIVVLAGGATVTLDKTGKTTFDSPAGITFTCGASSLAVTPAGIALASPAITAAGGGSILAMGAEQSAIKSKNVIIDSGGVCKVWGHQALKLQEAEKVKGGKRGGGGGSKRESVASPQEKRSDRVQKGAMPGSKSLEIHVVDRDGKPQKGLAFEILKPDGASDRGKLDKDGRAKVESSKSGIFTVRLPGLDGADWEGDGVQSLVGERTDTGKVTATSEDRMPALARDRGFRNWRTVWSFAANDQLKGLRQNPNVLWDGDKVAIPSQLKGTSQVTGGAADYVVNDAEERVVTFRLLDVDHEPFAGVRYETRGPFADINRGVVPDDGWVTLAIRPGTKKVVIELHISANVDDQPLEMQFEVQEEALDESLFHRHQRLLNLGMTAELPEGESEEDADAAALTVARYRSLVGDAQAEDADLLDQAVAAHDSGGGGEK